MNGLYKSVDVTATNQLCWSDEELQLDGGDKD